MTVPLKIKQRPPIRGGLASVAAPLEDVDWRAGVEVRAMPDGELFAVDTCTGDVYDLDGNMLPAKPVDEVGDGFKFLPVTVEKIVQCGPGATQTTIGDIAQQTASGSLDRQVYKMLARSVQFSLAPLASVPSGSDPNNPGGIRTALQGLLDGACGCFNSDPVFHIPRAWMPHFLGDVVRFDESTGTFRFGPHLVSFDCYANQDPSGTYATNPDGSEVWIFATAQPFVAVGEEDSVRVLTREQNNYKALVERHAIVAFDPTCALMSKAAV